MESSCEARSIVNFFLYSKGDLEQPLYGAHGAKLTMMTYAIVETYRTLYLGSDLRRSPVGPKRRKTTSARMSAIRGTSGLVVLRISFVARDPGCVKRSK